MIMNSGQQIDRLATYARITKFFGWSFAVLSVAQIAYAIYLLLRPPPAIVVTAGGGPPEMQILPIIIGLSALALLLSLIGVAVFSLVWIYRAHSNLIDHNIVMDYSPGWAVGSYFVPFVNLIVPFKAMRELYNRSHGEIPELAHSAVDDVFAWWVAYMVGLTLYFLLALKTLIDVFTNLVFLTPAWMELVMTSFAALLLVVAVIMLNKLIAAITQAQAESSHAWAVFE